MATMARDAWTDERLDDLKASVDAGFSDMRAESRAIREEVRGGRKEMREELRAGREEMREELKIGREETGEKFDRVVGDMREIRVEMASLNRTIHQFMFAIVGTIFLGFMGTISALIALA